MIPLLRPRKAALAVPASGSIYTAVGDSISDPNALNVRANTNIQGGYASTLAGMFGWTQAGLSLTAKKHMVTEGSGYGAAPTVGFSGGGASRQAAATCYMAGGAVIGLLYSDFGAGYTSAPTITFTPTSGGSGATAQCAVSGGSIIPPVPNNSTSGSWDSARAAITSTTMQSGGAAGSDFVSTYAARCTAFNPAVVSILLGMNDYIQANNSGLNPTNFKTAYQTVITAIKATASVKLVICIGIYPTFVPTLPSYAVSGSDLLRQMNQATQEIAMDNGCVFVPMTGISQASAYMPDGIHLSAIGHTWLANRIADALAGA